MPRIVRCGIIQSTCEWSPEKYSLPQIKEKMVQKHERMIAMAAKKKVQILGLQELFYGPYFCAEQKIRWYELTERVPNGPTISRCKSWREATRWCWWCRCMKWKWPAYITIPRLCLTRTAATWENIASTTFRTAIRDFGKNFISLLAMPAIPFLKRDTGESACTSATTVTFRRARGFWD